MVHDFVVLEIKDSEIKKDLPDFTFHDYGVHFEIVLGHVPGPFWVPFWDPGKSQNQ